MLDLRQVVDELDEVRDRLRTRSDKDAALLEPVAELAAERRRLIGEAQARAAARNVVSKEMAGLDKKSAAFAERRQVLKVLSDEAKELERAQHEVEAKLDRVLEQLPNLPDGSVPVGGGEADNQVVRTWGDKPEQDFEPKSHWDLGPALGILDFERAAKLSGPRFTVLMGLGARLERALIGFMLDLHTGEQGYTEVLPPFLIKDEALFGTGQLPKFAADLFRTSKAEEGKSYDLYLNPTAEVPLTNLHAGEILERERLPVAYTAYTPCFRSEAGSYGKDVRGMIRQHQFSKVELVRICEPEHSADELERLTGHAEQVLERLGLHYRRVLLCSGDMGFASQKTYDLEVWLPGQGQYREISSCSNCGDFQARRAKMRYRPGPKDKPRLVHTLNGSALAVGRTMIAILEQYQDADGGVRIPEVLRARMGCDRIPPPGSR